MVRFLLVRSKELIRSQPLIFGLLAIWAFAPLVAMLWHVANHGGVLTGANGSDAFDQMAYLAWIRDEGSHLFASNLWVIGHTPHDYLHPMYFISGLLWQLGFSVQLAYLVWKPVAVLVLFLGFAAYVSHLLPQSRRERAAALALALFYASPVLALADWTGHLSVGHRFDLILATDDANSALSLWGFEHTAIAIGLMPVYVLATERLLALRTDEHQRRRSWITVAALAGLLVAWLHPWQALMLLGITAGMIVLRAPRRRYWPLVVPVLATLLPLIYGLILSRTDASWRAFQQQTTASGTAPWWALIASFGPLAAFAALAVRRPRTDAEWMLGLWLFACGAVYFVVPEFPPHALSGITLPLAVLAVRGWRRVSERVALPLRLATVLATAAIAVVTVPAVIDHAQATGSDLSDSLSGAFARQLLILTPDQAAALSYLEHSKRPGGVLAPWLLSMSVPEFTGRTAFAGHPQWQPHGNVAISGSFFSPVLNDPTGAYRRALLVKTRATYVLAYCNAPATLARDIAPVARPVRHFGCVDVYETTRPPR